MSAATSEVSGDSGFPEELFEEYLRLLTIVESRIRRVRAIFRDAAGKRVAELTIRDRCVEPGVHIHGALFMDARLRHDAAWLATVLTKVAGKKLNSAEASRRLIRSTKEREVAEQELQDLTARALLVLAEIGLESRLAVEFTRSGPKRGPVYSFQSIELLASACGQYVGHDMTFDAAETLGRHADAVWNFRVSGAIPGLQLAPLPGTQGQATVRETLEMSALAGGLLELGGRIRFDSRTGSPVAIHYLADEFGIAWIANQNEIAIARLHGARSTMALGPSRNLVPMGFS